MNREIKFRAWDGNEILMPGTLSFQLAMNHPKGDVIAIPFNIQNYHSVDKEYAIMQFTGFKDNRGKEIYEGDIMKTFNGNYEVEFDSGQWQFKNFDHYGMYGEFPDFQECELIGNVFQNSFLLI
jgi:uncharacterized phage protein (TIGR01671 family)